MTDEKPVDWKEHYYILNKVVEGQNAEIERLSAELFDLRDNINTHPPEGCACRWEGYPTDRQVHECREHQDMREEIERLRRDLAGAESAQWRVMTSVHTIPSELNGFADPDPFEGPGETYRAAYERLRKIIEDYESPAWKANDRLNAWAEKAYAELERRGMTREEIARLVGQIE